MRSEICDRILSRDGTGCQRIFVEGSQIPSQIQRIADKMCLDSYAQSRHANSATQHIHHKVTTALPLLSLGATLASLLPFLSAFNFE